MNVRHLIPIALIALSMAEVALSQIYPSFPGRETEQATLRTQERVEELYLSGAYERAYFIYRNELAPRGDKYSQYMIGYMHFTGASVPEDPAVALAWYRLAAERGDPAIELARDQLQKTLSPEQLATADRRLIELRTELSDRVLLLELVRQDLDILRNSAGGGGSASSANMTMIDRRYGVTSDTNYYQMIRKRLNTRLTYLKAQVEVIDVESDPHTMELAEIESAFRELNAEIDKRQ